MEPREKCEERGGCILQRLKVFQRRLQRIALEKNAAFEVAETLAGRARLMADHCTRLVQHARTGDPRPPAEVDVFEVRKIVVVESTESEQRLAARNHIAAAREEQFRSRRRIITRRQRIAES